MWHIDDDKPRKWPDAANGKRPSDERTPVMTDQRRRCSSRCIDQPGDVPCQLSQRIILAPLRSARAAIAALIDSPYPVAEAGKKRDLIVPAHRMQRKPMQQQRQPVPFAGLEDLEFESIGRNHETARAQHAFQRITHAQSSCVRYLSHTRSASAGKHYRSWQDNKPAFMKHPKSRTVEDIGATRKFAGVQSIAPKAVEGLALDYERSMTSPARI